MSVTVRMVAEGRMDTSLGLADGRLVGVCEWGDRDGWPVVLVHGTPGSANWRPGPAGLAHLQERGVRLITVSRPGYGGSDRLAGRTVVAWADDAAEVVTALVGSSDWGIVGVSGGGPFALACGARLADTSGVAVLAGAGDLALEEAFVDMAEASAALWRSALDPGGALESLIGRIASAMARQDPVEVAERVLAAFPASAVTVMERDPAIRQVMVEDFVEAFAGGGWGWLDDARALRSAWGFELDEVTVPVRLIHGEDDEFVPVQHARRLADQLPDAVLSVVPGAGHMDLIAERFDDGVDWLIAQR
jgi:pimeloyl-ACP methyl ester carboxylesterase